MILLNLMSEEHPPRSRRRLIVIITAAILVAAGAFAAYTVGDAPDISPGDIVSDLDPLTGVPLSGTWSFKLDIGNLGSAYLYADPDANYVIMHADGQQLFFHNRSFSVPYTYQTTPRTQGGATAYFEFTAVDSDVIDGYVHHDQGTQSLHMELIEAELPDNEWFPLTQGSWNIAHEEAESDCEDDVVSFPDLPTSMELTTEYDLDTGEPTGDMHAQIGNQSLYLVAGENVNVYAQSGESVDAGIPVDNQGDLLLDYEHDTFPVEYEFYATTESSIDGYATISGSNGCSYIVPFSATL